MTLTLTDVTVRRGVGPVISGVSLEIVPGEVTTLVGPNGAGKTSLIESLSRASCRQRGGGIHMDGAASRSLAAARARAASPTSSRAAWSSPHSP